MVSAAILTVIRRWSSEKQDIEQYESNDDNIEQ